MPHKGYKPTNTHKMKISLAGKGRKFSVAHKERIGLALKGRVYSPETINKMKLARKGKKHSPETVEKRVASLLKVVPKGENHYRWKGGITSKNVQLRTCAEYKRWRRNIFIRDNFTCIWCGDRSRAGHKVILQAGHIKQVCMYPDLIFSPDNGRTLCKDCHKKRHHE